MAIYHLNIRHCSKSKGQSAQAKYSYICRADKYSKRHEDLQYSQSGNLPNFAENNPQSFWESADKFERANARVCTEIEFALPRELNLEQQKKLVNDFVQNTVGGSAHKLPYTFAIHNDIQNNNPHCHLIFSVRKQDGIERTAEQFFKRANDKKPELGGAKKDRDFIKQEFLNSVREKWAEIANSHLAKNGIDQKIDNRTLKEQGIDREAPQRLSRVDFQKLQKMQSEFKALSSEIENVQNAISEEVKNTKQHKAKQEELDDLSRTVGRFERDFDNLKTTFYEHEKTLKEIRENIKNGQEEMDKLTKWRTLKGFLPSGKSNEIRIEILEISLTNADRRYNEILPERNALAEKLNRINEKIKELKNNITEMLKTYPHLVYRTAQELLAQDEAKRREIRSQQFKKELERNIEQKQKNAQNRNLGQNLGQSGGFKI